MLTSKTRGLSNRLQLPAMIGAGTRVASTGIRVGILGLCLWLVYESAMIYPFYLAYFNELVGGPPNGAKYLVESNLDVGQDLKSLGAYVRRNHIQHLTLAYFGPDDPRRYGISYTWLKPGKPATGYVAISATFLQGDFAYDPRCVKAFEWLKRYEPIERVGYSIFVYLIPLSQQTAATEDVPPGCEKELVGSRIS